MASAASNARVHRAAERQWWNDENCASAAPVQRIVMPTLVKCVSIYLRTGGLLDNPKTADRISEAMAGGELPTSILR
jgi:hypothetical protein